MKLSILTLLITLLIPLFLIGLALRVLLSPIFYRAEYNMPYFPPDEYGFTKEDRLKWAPYAVNYLVNDADISYLGDLKFEDGTPLYNERELTHMLDVKRLTQSHVVRDVRSSERLIDDLLLFLHRPLNSLAAERRAVGGSGAPCLRTCARAACSARPAASDFGAIAR